MYDPSTARFLSKDPIEERGGSPNLYLYCANDPVNHTDPSGNLLIAVGEKTVQEVLWQLQNTYGLNLRTEVDVIPLGEGSKEIWENVPDAAGKGQKLFAIIPTYASRGVNPTANAPDKKNLDSPAVKALWEAFRPTPDLTDLLKPEGERSARLLFVAQIDPNMNSPIRLAPGKFKPLREIGALHTGRELVDGKQLYAGTQLDRPGTLLNAQQRKRLGLRFDAGLNWGAANGPVDQPQPIGPQWDDPISARDFLEKYLGLSENFKPVGSPGAAPRADDDEGEFQLVAMIPPKKPEQSEESRFRFYAVHSVELLGAGLTMAGGAALEFAPDPTLATKIAGPFVYAVGANAASQQIDALVNGRVRPSPLETTSTWVLEGAGLDKNEAAAISRNLKASAEIFSVHGQLYYATKTAQGGVNLYKATRGRPLIPGGVPASDVVTVYRGMTQAEFDKLVATLTLESKAMRAGLDTPPSTVRALWHTITSNYPKSPFVSTTTIPGIARRIFAKRPGDVVAEIKISRSALRKSINVPEAEYLAKGGTRVVSVQLAAADAKASVGAITVWLLESAAVTVHR